MRIISFQKHIFFHYPKQFLDMKNIFFSNKQA